MGRDRSPKNKHPLARLQKKGRRWYYVTSTQDPETGKQKRKWKPLGKDYSAALRQWAELEKSDVPTGKLFDDLAREYQLRVVPGWAKKSQGNWPFWLAALLKTFGGVHVEDIESKHIYGHVEKRMLEGKRASGLRERGVLGGMLKSAVEWGWIKINPALGVKIAQEEPRGRYLLDSEYAAIYKAAPESVRIAMEFGYLTGLRIGDLLKMLRSDVRAEGLFVEQDKNKVRGLYKLSPELTSLIARAKLLRKNSLWLISRRDGKPYTYYGFRAMWDRACVAAKVEDVTFRDIRAKAATDAEADGRDVQAFTLHRTKEMADRYVKAMRTTTVEPLRMRSTMLAK
jgi:integrase